MAKRKYNRAIKGKIGEHSVRTARNKLGRARAEEDKKILTPGSRLSYLASYPERKKRQAAEADLLREINRMKGRGGSLFKTPKKKTAKKKRSMFGEDKRKIEEKGYTQRKVKLISRTRRAKKTNRA